MNKKPRINRSPTRETSPASLDNEQMQEQEEKTKTLR